MDPTQAMASALMEAIEGFHAEEVGEGRRATYREIAADCVTVENMDVCLPHCDPSLGRNCRTNYSCCANHNVVTAAGDCAPSTTDLCH